MQRIITSTALVFAAALLFTGCATSSDDNTAAQGGSDDCEVVRVAVRDISNGAQNAILTSTEQAALLEKLDGYSERVDELDEQAADDTKLAEALDGLQEKIEAAETYAATLPTTETEDFEADADAQAAATGDIQAAAVTVTEVCSAE
ncbi:hypothetical protein ACFVAJ_06050 [Agromyces sp. NPDC057679]|uniref:hypothetical protein n=1 Tax=Agromyces sp. NPDC057679 TaxID=3346207 RepID=UPI00366BB720